jgi:hypothetical protein
VRVGASGDEARGGGGGTGGTGRHSAAARGVGSRTMIPDSVRGGVVRGAGGGTRALRRSRWSLWRIAFRAGILGRLSGMDVGKARPGAGVGARVVSEEVRRSVVVPILAVVESQKFSAMRGALAGRGFGGRVGQETDIVRLVELKAIKFKREEF